MDRAHCPSLSGRESQYQGHQKQLRSGQLKACRFPCPNSGCWSRNADAGAGEATWLLAGKLARAGFLNFLGAYFLLRFSGSLPAVPGGQRNILSFFPRHTLSRMRSG